MRNAESNKNRTVQTALIDEFGARMIVFVDDRNNAIGVYRKDGEPVRTDHPAIRAVVEAAGEFVATTEGGENGKWFAHPSGFLFCHGSRKAPAKTPSKVKPEDLAEAVRKALVNKPA